MVAEPICNDSASERFKDNFEGDQKGLDASNYASRSLDKFDDPKVKENLVYSAEDLNETLKSVEDEEQENTIVNTYFEREIDNEMADVLKTSWSNSGVESVRDVYKRACNIHCPRRALIKLKW